MNPFIYVPYQEDALMLQKEWEEMAVEFIRKQEINK